MGKGDMVRFFVRLRIPEINKNMEKCSVDFKGVLKWTYMINLSSGWNIPVCPNGNTIKR